MSTPTNNDTDKHWKAHKDAGTRAREQKAQEETHLEKYVTNNNKVNERRRHDKQIHRNTWATLKHPRNDAQQHEGKENQKTCSLMKGSQRENATIYK